MSDEQMLNLSPSAAGSLSSKQSSALYKSQKYALQLAIKGQSASEKSSSVVLFISNYLIIIVFAFITF